MKRYTVKNVVSLEQRADYLKEILITGEDHLMFFPLALLFAMGAGCTSLYFSGDLQSVAALIIGGALQLLGGGGYGYYATTEKRLDNLRKKLNDIYETMGKDFFEEVDKEVREQKYGVGTSKYTK